MYAILNKSKFMFENPLKRKNPVTKNSFISAEEFFHTKCLGCHVFYSEENNAHVRKGKIFFSSTQWYSLTSLHLFLFVHRAEKISEFVVLFLFSAYGSRSSRPCNPNRKMVRRTFNTYSINQEVLGQYVCISIAAFKRLSGSRWQLN